MKLKKNQNLWIPIVYRNAMWATYRSGSEPYIRPSAIAWPTRPWYPTRTRWSCGRPDIRRRTARKRSACRRLRFALWDQCTWLWTPSQFFRRLTGAAWSWVCWSSRRLGRDSLRSPSSCGSPVWATDTCYSRTARRPASRSWRRFWTAGTNRLRQAFSRQRIRDTHGTSTRTHTPGDGGPSTGRAWTEDDVFRCWAVVCDLNFFSFYRLHARGAPRWFSTMTPRERQFRTTTTNRLRRS